jgi:CDP-diglyceride synthetase
LLPQRVAAEPGEEPRRLWPWLLAGLAIAISLHALARRAPRTSAIVATGFWLTCGTLGLVLALSWAFTEHRALWANRNLLLLNPLCLLLLPCAWAVLRGREPSARLRMLLVAVAALAALALLPLWLQVEPQRNGHWIALLLPIHAAFALAWARRKA